MKEYIELAKQIRNSLQDLERISKRIIELSKKARTSGDDGYWDAVALNLHGFYSGLERVFEDIARTVEQKEPSGSRWHIELLNQMNIEIKNIRPAVISQATRNLLDEFLGIRHVVRNVYAFNLRSSKLNELVDELPKCLDSVKNDLMNFAKFLESV